MQTELISKITNEKKDKAYAYFLGQIWMYYRMQEWVFRLESQEFIARLL